MRAAIEAYMETEKRELAIQNVREAVDRVAPVLNALSFNKGYTPAKWALNTNPRDPTTILGDDIWGHLGPSWGHLGPSCGHLVAILGHLGAILGPSSAILELLGAKMWSKSKNIDFPFGF